MNRKHHMARLGGRTDKHKTERPSRRVALDVCLPRGTCRDAHYVVKCSYDAQGSCRRAGATSGTGTLIRLSDFAQVSSRSPFMPLAIHPDLISFDTSDRRFRPACCPVEDPAAAYTGEACTACPQPVSMPIRLIHSPAGMTTRSGISSTFGLKACWRYSRRAVFLGSAAE
jgi:hypothetical protein